MTPKPTHPWRRSMLPHELTAMRTHEAKQREHRKARALAAEAIAADRKRRAG